MKIIVTGCAGFIGYHVTKKLLESKDNIIIGIDILNDYYNVNQKEENLKELLQFENFSFYKDDIVHTRLIETHKPDKVCHLAAYAGVRYSIENPCIYARVNIEGFVNLIEQACKTNVGTFVYASSSSVYGLEKKVPFQEDFKIDACNSPYAVSKRCKEMYAEMYHRLYGISIIGLRFFTVYGPKGRPDMAPYKFLQSIINGSPLIQYGSGTSRRDYTYIDDIVDGIISALNNKKNLGCEVINLGNSNPVSLNDFIKTCEKVSNKKSNIEVKKEQIGDVPITFANIQKARELLDYEPQTGLEYGLEKTYLWLYQRSYLKTEKL
jgi:UDP-glucuronate 4-epimerase